MGTTDATIITNQLVYRSRNAGYPSVKGGKNSSITTSSSAIHSHWESMSDITTPTQSLRMVMSCPQQQRTPSSTWTSGSGPSSHTNSVRSNPVKSSVSTSRNTTKGTREEFTRHGYNSRDVSRMEDINRYARISSEMEQVDRNTPADVSGEKNEELLKQLRRDVRKVRRSSNRMLQSQKELLEKMSRHERSGIRRLFSVNREQKMEKLRGKLSAKLMEGVKVDEELQRLERQTLTLKRSASELSSSTSHLEIDELALLERERQELLSTIVMSSSRADIQELHARLASFSSEKKASQSVLRQVEHCEAYYRKALYQLQLALSMIVAPSYTGLLKDFVLGPYPSAVEAAHLVDGAGRMIQPESCRKYSEYAPELSGVRVPEFPPSMVEFAKRGARSNFDPNNAAAVEAIRKLRASENVVILMQRMVIEKLELIEKWRKVVETDLVQAYAGYHKCDTKLKEYMQAMVARPAAA